ncbi:GNAT family N-acetyltransferase [Devosia submarina]|uniref:GNAT family N-acetyltransferase n=1 Tax=Devosia submarina TaxID=1173082 RepID=UPI001FE8EAF0|nr:GNAT family N-acetyltransferase [Devosia submarina]
MAVEIKPIAMQYFDGFYRALDIVARERRFLSSDQAPPYESAANFVAGNIKTGNLQFVALDGSSVVGWCDICRQGNTFFRHCGTLGMGILPEYRGQGIGGRLLATTLQAARTSRFHRVQLEVFATNREAMALYRKHGFILEGTRKMAALIDGQGIDIHLMAITDQAEGG